MAKKERQVKPSTSGIITAGKKWKAVSEMATAKKKMFG